MKKNIWICPICNGLEYLIRTADNAIDGPGYKTWATGYECKTCSIRFGKPEKFDLNKLSKSPLSFDDSEKEFIASLGLDKFAT